MVRLEENPPLTDDEAVHGIELPPSNLYSDEPPLESDLHRNQIDLLIRLLKYWWRDRPDFYISGNLTVYQNVWRVPEYYWFHPDTLEFAGFRLVGGGYEALAPEENGQLPSTQLGLQLGIHERQLRWFTPEGDLIPLPEEAKRQRAEQERQRAEQAQQRLAQLEAFLKSQGIDPDQLPE